MVPVQWGDRLSLSVQSSRITKISLSTPGFKLPVEQNLVYRAADIFLKAFVADPVEVFMRLEKVVPTGAGLGGGSSDAAMVLRLLGQIFKVSTSSRQLRQMARSLGADVPFFLGNQAAWCTGVGDVCAPERRFPKLSFVIVLSPHIPVPTPWAYRALDDYRATCGVTPSMPGRPSFLDLTDWTVPALENDFEEVVLALKPRLRRVRAELIRAGALAVSMSGSGSSFFGVFKDRGAAERACRDLRRKGMSVLATEN